MLVSGDGGADRAFGIVFPAHINRSAVKGKADALIGSAAQHGKRRFKHGITKDKFIFVTAVKESGVAKSNKTIL